MLEQVTRAGLVTPAQQAHFPVIIRSGTLNDGHAVHYILNYAATPSTAPYAYPAGHNLLDNAAIPATAPITLPAWGFAVVEEDSPSAN